MLLLVHLTPSVCLVLKCEQAEYKRQDGSVMGHPGGLKSVPGPLSHLLPLAVLVYPLTVCCQMNKILLKVI